MTQKRRGLGKGLGALIPTGPEDDRPVNVFFPSVTGEDEGVSSSAVGTESTSDGEDSATGVDGVSGQTESLSDTGSTTEAASSEGERSAAHNTVPRTTALKSTSGSASATRTRQVGAVIVENAESETLPDSSNDVSRETGTPRMPADGEGDVSEAAAEATPLSVPAPKDPGPELVPVPGARFAEISIDAILPNSRQPRVVFDEAELVELVGSIKEVGILQPVVVRPMSEAGQYELIMGERRLRAAKEAELESVPAIIRDTEDADMLRDALLENLHRTNLNPLEEAAAYQQLLEDFGCTHEELADRIARSRPQISNTLRLLKLPPLVQRRVAAGVLSAGHARALLGLDDGAAMERLAQRIVAEGLSVRATEEIVALGTPAEKKRRQPRPGQRSAAVDELAARLSDRFETRVRVNLGKNKGRLTVEFASVEDLNRILDILAPSDPGLLRQS